MNRRTVLQRAAAAGAAASLAGLAGCLDGGSRAGDQRSFTETYNYDTPTQTPKAKFVSKGAPSLSKPDENHLVVGLTVVNKTDAKGTATVTAIVTFRKEVETTGTATGTTTKTVTREQTKSVTLAAGASETVKFEFEIPENANFDGLQFDIGSK